MATTNVGVQLFVFDPESDPEQGGEDPAAVRTLGMQKDVTEWLVTSFFEVCLHYIQ